MTRVEQLWQQAQDEHYPRDTMLVLADAMEEAGSDMHRGVREYVRRKACPTAHGRLWWWLCSSLVPLPGDRSEVSPAMANELRMTALEVTENDTWFGFIDQSTAIVAWVHAFVHQETG